MKHIKIIWYSLMVIFLFAGLYSGSREFFLLFFIMLFVILYALSLNLWTIFSFSFIQELSQPAVVKGSVAHLKIGIYNDKPFPFTLMKIRVETVTPHETYELGFNLSPKSNINYMIPLNCPYRGVYAVGMTTIEVNDVFGLVKTRFDMRRLSYYRQRLIKIFPRLVELPYLPTRNNDSKYSGGVALRLAEDGDSYADLRRYRPGDPLKRVHKPVSARKRELYVKNYDIPLETTVLIAIDPTMELGDGEEKRYLADIACECAVSIAEISMRSGFTVEFAGIDLSRSLKRRRKQEVLSALCDALAELPFDGEGDFDRELELAITRAGGIRAAYIISSGNTASYAGAFYRLQQEGCHVSRLKIISADKKQENDDVVFGIGSINISPGDDIQEILTGEIK